MNLITVKTARAILKRCDGWPPQLRVGRRILIAAPIPGQSWALEKRADGLVQLGRLRDDCTIDWETPVVP